MQLALVRRPTQDEDEWLELRRAADVGRDALTEAVRSLGTDGALPAGFPSRAVGPLKRLGSTLGDDELMEVGNPVQSRRKASLDRTTSEVLAEIDALLPPAPVPADLVGVLTEFDGAQASFRIRSDAGEHQCRLTSGDAALAEQVHRLVALDGVTAPDVLVSGETLSPESSRMVLFNVHSVQVVRTVAEKVIVHKVQRIQALEAGWLGAGSVAPASDLTDRVLALAADIAGMAIPVAVVPDADGSVVLEWRRGHVELTATLAAGNAVHLMADDMETDQIRQYEGDFDVELLRTFLRTGDLPQ